MSKLIRNLVFILAAAAASVPALAFDGNVGFGVSPKATATWASGYKPDSSAASVLPSLHLDAKLSALTNLPVFVHAEYMEEPAGAEGARVDIYSLSALYEFREGQPLRPYVFAGGTVMTSADMATNANAFRFGVGARYAITKKIDLDASYSGYKNQDTLTFLTIGANYKF